MTEPFKPTLLDALLPHELELQKREDMHEIVPGFWLGSFPVGELLSPHLKYSVSLAGPGPYQVADHQRKFETYFTDGLLPEIGMIEGLAALVNSLRKEGPTLVHCWAGQNRSALVMGLALIRSGIPAKEAINLMRTRRSQAVLNNPHFRNWLLTQ